MTNGWSVLNWQLGRDEKSEGSEALRLDQGHWIYIYKVVKKCSEVMDGEEMTFGESVKWSPEIGDAKTEMLLYLIENGALKRRRAMAPAPLFKKWKSGIAMSRTEIRFRLILVRRKLRKHLAESFMDRRIALLIAPQLISTSTLDSRYKPPQFIRSDVPKNPNFRYAYR